MAMNEKGIRGSFYIQESNGNISFVTKGKSSSFQSDSKGENSMNLGICDVVSSYYVFPITKYMPITSFSLLRKN